MKTEAKIDNPFYNIAPKHLLINFIIEDDLPADARLIGGVNKGRNV